MPATIRERLSDRLLRGSITLGTEREQLLRSVHGADRGEHAYEQVAGTLWIASGFEAALRWLAMRLRPHAAFRHPSALS